MGSLARQARRQRERQAGKRLVSHGHVQLNGDRLLPPAGVPARLWVDVLHEHAELVVRLRHVEETGDDVSLLLEQLTKAINDRTAAELDLTDESDDGMADRMEFLLERYAALIEAGDEPERPEFERNWPEVVEFARGEGASIFAQYIDREREIRSRLPVI